jgi:glycosyltransferase involved in cell wall biosynthesis
VTGRPPLTVVSSFFPLPQDRGDPVRVLMLLRSLAQHRDYALLAVRRTDTTREHVEQLRKLLPNVDVRVHDAAPYRIRRLGPFGRYAEASRAEMPPWVRSRYSATLNEELSARDGRGFAIGEAAGAYVRNARLTWHWDKANVLAASTEQDIAEAPDLAHRVRARYLAHVSRRFEADVLKHCATVSVTSDEEAARLRTFHGRDADLTLPSCVSIPFDHVPRPQPRRLVWLSSFSYASNLFGLRRFLDEAWADLHGAGFTLQLVGSGLTPEIRRSIAGYDSIEALGYVDDLRSVLAEARAGIVPLWSGAGVKLKTLTLLAHSVPVFSTPVGAEGLPATEAVRLAPTPTSLAESIIKSSPEQLDTMAAEAARLVRTHFSEGEFAKRLTMFLTANGHPADMSRAHDDGL